jgi:hypothetical protein
MKHAVSSRTYLKTYLMSWDNRTSFDKGKPVARRGRKATGLYRGEAAGLPKGAVDEAILISPPE